MKDMELFIDSLRNQRHDFMNDIQVLYGYMQINKYEEALRYLKKISKENENISNIYNLGDKFLGYILENNIKTMNKYGILLDIELEISSFNDIYFEKDFYKKRHLVNNIFNELKKNSEKIYVYLFEDELGKSLLISNNEEVKDELDWIEEWNNIQVDIEKFYIYRYKDNGEIGYRIIFEKK
ncbi:Spo0B domain-containing protein [Clostridium cochlearium]|uniref:Spo0B domain-containing protein n=1 Tax=Clostridium cochlearium TaxID=1494 RepID=UPI000BBC3DEC|nr:Spo0B domain-containing protein [Clostridium cochlearium]